LELAELVRSKRSYASAAADEGSSALNGVTAFLASAAASGDEEGMEAASAVLAAAGGDAASGGGEVDLFVSLRKNQKNKSLSSSSSSSSSSLAAAPAPATAPAPAPAPALAPPPKLPLRRVPSRKKIRISQASLGDGLGARLWAAAPVLLAALDGRRPPKEVEEKDEKDKDEKVEKDRDGDEEKTSCPSLSLPSVSPPPVQGATVLELGCGTGAGALACVALGAARVSMTDGERRVLEVARRGVAQTLSSWAEEEEEEEREREEEERSDSSPSTSDNCRSCCCWDDPGGKLTIRRLSWGDGAKLKEERRESAAALPKCERRNRKKNDGDGGDDGDGDGDDDKETPPLCPACASSGPPHLDDDDGEDSSDRLLNAFDVIVAADVLYDESSAPSLAEEVAARLSRVPSPLWVQRQKELNDSSSSSSSPSPPPRPAAFFACPVRESRFLSNLLESARGKGLAIAFVRDDEALDQAREREGVRGAGRARDYEGGFVFLRMEWPR